MKRKYLYQLAFFACFLFLLSGCKKNQKENDCLFFANAPVTKIEGAASVLVNQEAELTITWISGNSCGVFERFEQNIVGNTTMVDVKARYQKCICLQILQPRETLYKFKKSQAGIYEVKLLKDDNTYLTHTITVQ